MGEHHDHGGLLFRRDVHRLFDLGQLAIDPVSLEVDVHPKLATYGSYSQLHGKPLSVPVNDGHRRWFKAHWLEHRQSA